MLGSANVAQAVLTAQAHELIERSALGRVLARIAPGPAPDEALLAVHTAEYLDRLRAACAGGPWDGEYAPVTPATWDAARLTVGGVLAAVDAVLEGRVQRALVHARPAGHHAEPDRAIASTYLNNVACGVEHARARGRRARGDHRLGRARRQRRRADLLGPRRRPRDLPAPAGLVPRARWSAASHRRTGRGGEHGERAAPARDHRRRLPARVRRDRRADRASLQARSDHGRGRPGRVGVRPDRPDARLRGRLPDARRARRAASRTSSPKGDSWPAPKAATARSTTRSACSACSKGWPARAPGSPTHGTTTPRCAPRAQRADDRVRAAIAAVRGAQPRWFS